MRVLFSLTELAFKSDMQEAISFFAKRELGDAVVRLEPGTQTSILVHIERDQFMRRPSVRMRIVGIE